MTLLSANQIAYIFRANDKLYIYNFLNLDQYSTSKKMIAFVKVLYSKKYI